MSIQSEWLIPACSVRSVKRFSTAWEKNERVSTGGEKREQTPTTKGPPLLSAPAKLYTLGSAEGGQGLTGARRVWMLQGPQPGCAELCGAEAAGTAQGDSQAGRAG